MESLRPVVYDDLMEAADLLENFKTYWDGCENVGNPPEARKQLLAKIVEKVFVYDQNVLAVALHGDFSIVLDNGTFAPHEVVEGLNMEIGTTKKGANESNSTCTLDGSDGLGYLSRHRCVIWSENMNHPAIVRYLLQNAVDSTISNSFTV